ncbi:MAG: phosphatidylglycerol---prolipoprotein diacylglyceryl transferase [Eubacteriales bacterium]|nr:phosphatidylglycerol---prolipoprotein diacylglyceryl transferase [Eubacteriales bacterium]MDN5364547.1 phosphatidylglycerol---prolipoprotein diacylglyceryl transferase [Eubacteriales bacterium]
MLPVLFKLGRIEIHSWGLMLAVAVLLGTYLVIRRGVKLDYDADRLLNLTILVLISGIAGARLFYVLFYAPAYYFAHPLEILFVWQGGLVFYGGLLAALTAGWWYVRRQGWSFWDTADLVAPVLALGYGIVRIGCFLNGCCYGKVTSPRWGVIFPAVDNFYRYPTQLYSSAFGFLLFFFLLWWEKRKKFPGQVFLTFLILYGAGRAVIEAFRDNLRVWGPVTISQLISFLLIPAGIIAYVYLKKQKNNSGG